MHQLGTYTDIPLWVAGKLSIDEREWENPTNMIWRELDEQITAGILWEILEEETII